MSIESVMPSNHLILCRPLLLLPPSFPVSESFSVSWLFPSGGPICLKLSLWKFSWRCKTGPQEASIESHMTVSSWQLGMEGPALGWVGVKGLGQLGTWVASKSFIREGELDLRLERRGGRDGRCMLRSCSSCRDSGDTGTRRECWWTVWLSDVCIFLEISVKTRWAALGKTEQSIIKTVWRSLKLIGWLVQNRKFLLKEMTQWHDIYMQLVTGYPEWLELGTMEVGRLGVRNRWWELIRLRPGLGRMGVSEKKFFFKYLFGCAGF